MDAKMINRNIETLVNDTLNDTPVTVIQGARQVGKSTLALMVSKHRKCMHVTLDSDIALTAAKENPYEFVSQFPEGLLIIDEIQRCPDLLKAIKLSVDENRKPGRFLITGSANILNLRKSNESLAGRAESIILQPFSVGEKNGIKESFITTLMQENMLSSFRDMAAYSRMQYSELIESGGYPEAQNRTDKRRKAYFKNYITRVLDHDANELSGLAHLELLKKLYIMLAGNPSQIYVRANVSRIMAIPESSMNGYMRLLEDLCLLHFLPAWGKNYSKRALSRPKIVLSDTGLVCSLHNITGSFLAKIENGNQLGSLLETLVISEIIKQRSWSETDYTLYHYRDSDNKEVDLIIELDNGKLVALEIKAASSFSQKDLSGLKLLKELLGNRFLCGLLLYTGKDVTPLGERLYAVPISTIWQ
ncbi:MAG: ATP-binding protein [Lachnospiraceae bacterium]|nr:ATP-binding protein [Lachnospiraceae bacterium]